ncbi:hypothetical protein LCGC14_2404720, partial [marine sediment metagenome]
FVNTLLGETWQERGEAPDWEKLYARRESYPIASVPEGVIFLTEGVDLQKDRILYEVVGWCLDKQSYSIDFAVIMGEPVESGAHVVTAETWKKLDVHLLRTYPGADGRQWPVAMSAIDAGYDTQTVYNYCRHKSMSRVIAVMGVATERSLVGLPSPVDVTWKGKRHQRGYKVWPVGGAVAKSELYGLLRLPVVPDGQAYPAGYCHFPEYGVEYFKQLTSEHLVPVTKQTGHVRHEWRVLPGRENHGLDMRVYARAAASVQGLDRARPPGDAPPPERPKPEPTSPQPDDEPPREKRARKTGKGGWLDTGRGKRRGRGDWLRGRRR